MLVWLWMVAAQMHEVAVPPGARSPHALGGMWTFTPMEPVPGPVLSDKDGDTSGFVSV